MDLIENVEKVEDTPAMSAGNRSPKAERVIITRPMRLRIIQQAIYDYQKAGGLVDFVELPTGSLAIVMANVAMNEHGNLIEHGNLSDENGGN